MALPLIAELNRRRVFRALIVYGVVALAVLQIAEPVMHGFHWPDAVLNYIVVLLAFGFPVVVGLAWIFDVKASGIERSALDPAARALRGAPLALLLAGIGALAAAPGLFYYFLVRAKPATPASASMPSVAVLPFADMSPQKDQEYLSDGIAEEILNALAQIDGLRVIGRTSSFSFKGKNEDLRGIGEKLGAANLLEGSVRKSGTRIRVTTQLVDAARGSHLWSHAYDRDLTDIFALQDEIANAVVAALTSKLLVEGRAVSQEPRTANAEAYRLYLVGKQFDKRGSADGNRRSIEAFEAALALDPNYAPAWVELAKARLGRYGAFAESLAEAVENLELAFAAAEKGVALAPEMAGGYFARGTARSYLKWDWMGARADYERALALDPSNTLVLNGYQWLLATLGGNRTREALTARGKAIAALRKAIELDPLNSLNWALLNGQYFAADQFDLARSTLKRFIELAPEDDFAPSSLGWLSLSEGKPAAALDHFTRCPIGWARLTGTAIAQHDLGHPDESMKALDGLIAKFSSVSAYQIAEVYAWRGDRDRAFEWLERAYRQHDGGLGQLKYDRFLPKLRRDPRYNAMLRKINLPVD